VYFASGGVLEVGIAGTGGFSIRLTNASAVLTYLPASGTAAALVADVNNPTTTSSGLLGGELTALALNVDSSAAGLLGGSVATDFGDLNICGVAGLPNMTVTTFRAIAENTLGGANNGYLPSAIVLVAQDLNAAFQDGTPSTFAQDHLVIGACPWNAGDMETASQASWGDPATTAGSLLNFNFDSLYPSDLIVGGTNTMRFTNAAAVYGYLPASGSASILTSSLLDPVTTSSGELGGEVVGLKLNVDFSATFGNAVSLGDLRICNFASLPGLNGTTVNEFLAVANHLLGGGSATISPTSAAAVARFINGAFVGGSPSTFAQSNLVAGACN